MVWRWRVGWSWYLVVLVGPAAFALAVAGVVVLLGGTWSAALPSLLGDQAWALLVAVLLGAVLLAILGECPVRDQS